MATGSNPKNTISWTRPDLTPDLLNKNKIAAPKSVSLSDSAMTGAPSWNPRRTAQAGAKSTGGYSGKKTSGGMTQALPAQQLTAQGLPAQNRFIAQGAKGGGGPRLTWQPGSDPQRIKGWNQGPQQYDPTMPPGDAPITADTPGLDPMTQSVYQYMPSQESAGFPEIYSGAYDLLPDEAKMNAMNQGVGMGDLGKFMYDQYRMYWDEQAKQWADLEERSALWTAMPGENAGEAPVEEPPADGGYYPYSGGWSGYVPFKYPSGGGGGGYYGSGVNWRIKI